MAAIQYVSPSPLLDQVEVVELSQVPVQELLPLFAEEIDTWQSRFKWDFGPSAELLARYIRAQSLLGYVLRVGGITAGYTYFVCEQLKSLIGDFFISAAFSGPAHERLLLETVVNAIMHIPGIRRIESQLMNLRYQSSAVPFPAYVRQFDRLFMELPAAQISHLAEVVPAVDVVFVPWVERYQEEIAHLVSAAYRGHVDSDINDQYRNIPGARHFLVNIVRYPGCGNFSRQSSVLAIDKHTGRVCGVCLASKVGPRAGHITQLCILPGMRGARLGYELMRRSLLELRNQDCDVVSLTVTCSNLTAIRLYESLGFEARSCFPALVWEGY
jgi:ribosomal protein S18 acetylase RimI-like enzyme